MLASCAQSPGEIIGEMKAPVIVKSRGSDSFGEVAVILVDANGRVEAMSSYVFESVQAGDTLVAAPNKNLHVRLAPAVDTNVSVKLSNDN